MLPLLICGPQNLLSEIGHEINGWPLDHRKLEDEVSSFMSKAAQTGIIIHKYIVACRMRPATVVASLLEQMWTPWND